MVADIDWKPWFAWYPVYVDAYQISEIVNGKTRYAVFGRMVERMWVPERFDDEDTADVYHAHWNYRLPRV